MSHRCGGCVSTWGGSAECHCATCHNTFSVLAHFDKHRRAGSCKEPDLLGLQKNAAGVWRAPNEHYNFEKEAGE